jgi:hypothetical protein
MSSPERHLKLVPEPSTTLILDRCLRQKFSKWAELHAEQPTRTETEEFVEVINLSTVSEKNNDTYVLACTAGNCNEICTVTVSIVDRVANIEFPYPESFSECRTLTE